MVTTYTTETSGPIHTQIDQHDSYSNNNKAKNIQSTAEVQHFHKHKFKNAIIEIAQIINQNIFIWSHYT